MSEVADMESGESLERLRDLLNKFGSSKVTLIGDTMLDRFHHGFANNLNSTSPVPVLKVINTEESPGASAHIALGLTSLGIEVDYHCCVGNDPEGKAILDFLSNQGVDISGVINIDDWRTLTKIRFYGSRESLLDNSQILLQADRGPSVGPSEEIVSSISDSAIKSLEDSCALVISDYDKGVVNNIGANALIKHSKKLGIPVIADPKLTGLDKVNGATVALFEIRGLELLRRRLMMENALEAASKLMEEHDWDSLVVLGGVNGLTLYESDGSTMFMPCKAPNPKQQIGLHDAAATALAAALGHDLGIKDAAMLAAAACECILSATSSREFIDRSTLGLWLDELSWQLQISER